MEGPIPGEQRLISGSTPPDPGLHPTGPCGGTSNWGANGVFEGTPGLALALTINYNGGWWNILLFIEP